MYFSFKSFRFWTKTALETAIFKLFCNWGTWHSKRINFALIFAYYDEVLMCSLESFSLTLSLCIKTLYELECSVFNRLHAWPYPFFKHLRCLLPGPKTLFLDRYYFHPRVCVCVCVCVCVSIFISIISKSSWPILMKLGRMM